MTSLPDSTLSIVDLHSHLVPGVDDGTRTMDESLEALAKLYQEGVRSAVTTPHLLLPHLPTDAAIQRELDLHRRAFDELTGACEGREGLPTVWLGQEIWAPDASSVRRVTRRSDVGLPGKFLLVEFGFDLQGNHNDVVREVLDAGRQIVIAHPERYYYLPGHEPLDVMHTWQELGALLQVNVGSLTGHYQGSSPGSEALAWRMISSGMVDVLATDHHGPRRQGVSPREALDTLIARGGLALAERAMAEIPGRIVRDDLVALRLPR
ncbi:MAG TPA: CpsB/CapC family capsule biosynthesis tyrosine phosphatase [Gemmatimonadales bacterium]|jgi:protein-tyrosine phosphatase